MKVRAPVLALRWRSSSPARVFQDKVRSALRRHNSSPTLHAAPKPSPTRILRHGCDPAQLASAARVIFAPTHRPALCRDISTAGHSPSLRQPMLRCIRVQAPVVGNRIPPSPPTPPPSADTHPAATHAATETKPASAARPHAAGRRPARTNRTEIHPMSGWYPHADVSGRDRRRSYGRVHSAAGGAEGQAPSKRAT